MNTPSRWPVSTLRISIALLPQPMIWPVPIYATDVGISPHCRTMFFDTCNQSEKNLTSPIFIYSYSASVIRYSETVFWMESWNGKDCDTNINLLCQCRLLLFHFHFAYITHCTELLDHLKGFKHVSFSMLQCLSHHTEEWEYCWAKEKERRERWWNTEHNPT